MRRKALRSDLPFGDTMEPHTAIEKKTGFSAEKVLYFYIQRPFYRPPHYFNYHSHPFLGPRDIKRSV
jgi:hypothetical protein